MAEKAPPSEAVKQLRERWKSLWQVPVLVVGGGLFVTGLVALVATKPAPDFVSPLREAEQLISQEQYQDAIGLLNREVFPYVGRPELSEMHRAEFHLQLARALYRGQRALGIDRSENHSAIIAEYLEAETHRGQLTPRDAEAIAETYLSMGMHERAISRARTIPDSERDRRVGVYRNVVEDWLSLPVPRRDEALTLLADMMAEEALGIEERAWALARQTVVLLDKGLVDDAITGLLRSMPRLDGASMRSIGELHVLLARAYYESNAIDEAEKQVEHAEGLIEPGGELEAQTMLYRGLVAVVRNEPEVAQELFSVLIKRFGSTPSAARAMLGLAEVESSLGNPIAAQNAYREIRQLLNDPATRGLTREDVTTSLLLRYREHAIASDTENALAYATMAWDLHNPETAPVEAIEAMARAHEASALRLIGQDSDDDGVRLELRDMDPSAQRQAQRHLIRSASYFRLHADRHILTNNGTFAESLWNAGDLFDSAGDHEEAISAFAEFAQGMPGHPRQAAARYRLGQAYQAQGDYNIAAEHYRKLIEDEREGQVNVGRFGDLSRVPLAQAYLLDAEPGNDAEAEQLLQAAVSGSLGGPSTTFFRDALVELGRVYYQTRRYPEAIRRLEEARSRFPDDPHASAVRYLLADALRLSAQSIAEQLGQGLTDLERRDLRSKRIAQLREAMSLFERVRTDLGSIPAGRRSGTDEVYLRNAYFYLGDCAFDLASSSDEYDVAVRYYDAARDRYPQDPASLVAMVQIVNAHIEQGDVLRARTANERARRFYQSLPDDVWNDPNLPMSRRDWERWLESSAALYATGG